MGKVLDKETKEPIPFVNMILKGTNFGATSNFEGLFTIEAKTKSDTLIVSCIGYKSQRIRIQKGSFQKFDVLMEPSSTRLQEVVVKYTGNPADRILDGVRKNKEKNNSFGYNYIEYEAYNKIQFDINNIDEKFTKSSIQFYL